MEAVINFYSAGEHPYGVFSNFLKNYPTKIGNYTWPTTEHYFQAMKFDDPLYQRKIRNVDEPMMAAKLGKILMRVREDIK